MCDTAYLFASPLQTFAAKEWSLGGQKLGKGWSKKVRVSYLSPQGILPLTSGISKGHYSTKPFKLHLFSYNWAKNFIIKSNAINKTVGEKFTLFKYREI